MKIASNTLNLLFTMISKHLRVLALGATLLVVALPANAQVKRFRGKPIEVGLTLGGANYMGDLTPLVAWNETKPMGGIICRFNYDDFITLRGNAVFGQISGDDKNYSDIAERYKRNLNFTSNVLEFSGTVEWNLLGFEETQRSNPGTPFLFAGIGVFKFNPKTQFNYLPDVHTPANYNGADLSVYDGKWIELQPMATEGQETTKYNDRRRYSLTQVSIPIGVGYKKQFSEVWAWGLELGVRKTFTDYLDDVSMTYVDPQITGGSNTGLSAALADRTPELRDPSLVNDYGNEERLGAARGNEATKDWYLFLNFTLTRKITGGKTTCFQF
jgi:hypothetical protein